MASRVQVLLKADEGCTDKAVAAALDMDTATVGRVRKRPVEGGLEQALRERPRPGGRWGLGGKQEAHLIAGLRPIHLARDGAAGAFVDGMRYAFFAMMGIAALGVIACLSVDERWDRGEGGTLQRPSLLEVQTLPRVSRSGASV